MNKVVNYAMTGSQGSAPNAGGANTPAGEKFQLPNETLSQNLIQKSLVEAKGLSTFNPAIISDLRMNHLENLERSLYMKDLMNLPKEMSEILVLLQKNAASSAEAAALMSSNIELTQLAELIQKSGKEALGKLIQAMADASKQGIGDLSQLKETMRLINASVSVAGQDNASQILKSFMLMYLPWLPLPEGVDFELEFDQQEESEEESDLSVTILISTKHYGNIRVTLILLAGNSMSIIINCDDEFPKEELLKRIKDECKKHSMQSDVTFEPKTTKKSEDAIHQAKVSMSNLKEVNPFLLLMTNAVIRHTIEIDNRG